MKKAISILFLVSGIIFHAAAQDDGTLPGQSSSKKSTSSSDAPKGYVSMRLGLSVPTGDFGDLDVNNEFAGLAYPGVGLSFNGGYAFFKGFGLAASWMGSVNIVEIEDFGIDNSSPWLIGALSVGPMYMGGSNKFNFDVHLLFGGSSVTAPDFGGLLPDADGGAFALTLGGTGRLALTKKFFISGSLDIFSTYPTFERVIGDFEQSITMVLLNGGIGFLL